jgi:hypothetical protein
LKSTSRTEKPPHKPVKKRDHHPDVLPLAERIRRFEDGPGEATEGLGKGDGKLKRLVAELALDKQILKDIAEGNF